jgi:hypothetical protein
MLPVVLLFVLVECLGRPLPLYSSVYIVTVIQLPHGKAL